MNSGSISRAISRSAGLANPEILAAILEPLPETEDELRFLASRHAPENRRLFLQRDATEAVARAIDVDRPGQHDGAGHDHTVEFTLKEPSAIFGSILPDILVVNADVVKENEVDGDWGGQYLTDNVSGS